MSVGVPVLTDKLCLWTVLVTKIVMFTLSRRCRNHLLDPPPPAALDCPTDLGTVYYTDAVADSDRRTRSECLVSDSPPPTDPGLPLGIAYITGKCLPIMLPSESVWSASADGPESSDQSERLRLDVSRCPRTD